MIVRIKSRLLVLTAESAAEREELAQFGAERGGHVFVLDVQDERTIRLTALGPRVDACREPINVTSRASDPAIRLISNFAATPFELDGRAYGSVESFWQGLKYPDEAMRRSIAPLHGGAARQAGAAAPPAESFQYEGRRILVGTVDHWHLMERACEAKFRQHEAARSALLDTGQRPLTHRMRRDSRSIPGVVMADLWMRIRQRLQAETDPPARRRRSARPGDLPPRTNEVE